MITTDTEKQTSVCEVLANCILELGRWDVKCPLKSPNCHSTGCIIMGTNVRLAPVLSVRHGPRVRPRLFLPLRLFFFLNSHRQTEREFHPLTLSAKTGMRACVAVSRAPGSRVMSTLAGIFQYRTYHGSAGLVCGHEGQMNKLRSTDGWSLRIRCPGC